MDKEIGLLLDIDVIFSEEDGVTSQRVDLSDKNVAMTFVVGFGNKIFREIRAVGRTMQAARRFVEILEAGGFSRYDGSPPKGRELYKSGDICFPKEDPFVFLSSLTQTGQVIDFHG